MIETPRPYRRPPGVAPALRDSDEPQPLTPAFAQRYVITFLALILLLPLSGIGSLTRSLLARIGYGNNGVIVTHEGWLFDERDVRALTGLGPLVSTKPSTLHLPRLPGPTTAQDAILDFAR